MGIIISQAEPETVWNAFRFANHAMEKRHTVTVFLLGKGVECEDITDKHFNVREQINGFLDAGGAILACGTCLKSRNKEGSAVCPISTMDELLRIVEESDKVVSF
ncbi:MAG: sulfur reduction protein DsrE [Nitrospinae bacterium CG11_big_fil_rev_8_21_14_0_20_56_8]|nr:MAG: sulfur reduction protein DsrE [Nitrospinae bacterium CG11_big_fil_rev_8_21_14_0_20_56_8]